MACVQIYIQLYGIAFTSAWTAVMTVVIFLIVDRCGGMRVPEVHEAIGLDIAYHKETIVAMPKKKLADLLRKCEGASVSWHRGETMEELDLDTIRHGDELCDDEDDNGEDIDARTGQGDMEFDADRSDFVRTKQYRSKSILMDGSVDGDSDDT